MKKSFITNIFKNTSLFLFIVIILALTYRTAYFFLLENGRFVSNSAILPMEANFLAQVVGPHKSNIYFYVARDMPIYPLILLVSHKFFGGLLAARIWNIFFSTFTCLIIYFLGKELSNRTIGKIAALIYALYFPAIRWVPTLHIETFQIFITTLSIYYMTIAIKQNNVKSYLIAGIASAVSTLTKPIPFIFLAIFIPLILLNNKSCLKKGFVYSLLVIIIHIAFLTPWLIRNFYYYKTPVLFTTHGGHHFQCGNHVHYTGGRGGWIDEAPKYRTRHPELEAVTLSKPVNRNRATLDNYYYKLGFKFIRRYPKVFLELIPLKFYNMWRFNYAGNKNILRIFSEVFGYLLMLPFFFFAGIHYLKPRYLFKEINLCLIAFLFVLIHMLLFVIFPGMIRYRLPLMPCIQLVGLYGMELFLKGFKKN